MEQPGSKFIFFLKRWNTGSHVEAVCIVVFSFLLTATIFSGVRAASDDSAWPVVVCVFNVISLAFLVLEVWFFSFKNFLTLLLLLMIDSVSTVGNILMCFMGDLYMRYLSIVILIVSLAAKGTCMAFIISTFVRVITDVAERE